MTAWLDRQILPASRLYLQGFYDPEGLLSSLPALASTLIGVLTGFELLKHKAGSLKWTFLTGASCLAMGLAWSPWFPLNKRLWTSSFVLVTAGISLIVLGLLSWWLDEHGERGRALVPFRIFGINALAAYIFSDVLATLLSSARVPHTDMTLKRWLFQPVPTFLPNRYVAGLICAIVFVGLCFLPVWLLYRRRIYLKV
jgi:predicted acyltransferase